MKKQTVVLMAGVIALSMGLIPVFAKDNGEDKTKAQPTMEEIQQVWAKAGTPGEPHKRLTDMAGSWEYSSKMWMDPSAPSAESKGVCERKAILGGRYLYEEFEGNFQGMPFKGIAITGYDNIEKKFKTIWLDNMSTTMMIGEGVCDETGKEFKYTLKYTDAMTGKPTSARTVTKIVGPNEHLFEYFSTGPDGKEFKSMEIVYKRK